MHTSQHTHNWELTMVTNGKRTARETLAGFLDDMKEPEPATPAPATDNRAVLKRVRRQARRIEQRKQRAWRSGWLSYRGAIGNPLLVRLALELETLGREARRCATDHLAEIVGRIAEDCD